MTRHRRRQPHRQNHLKSTNDHLYTRPRGQAEYDLFRRIRRKLSNLQQMGKIHDWYTYYQEENHFTGFRKGLMIAVQYKPATNWQNYTPEQFFEAMNFVMKDR